MARIKPEATIDKQINGHQLYAEKWGGKWVVIRCPSWPDLAKQHEGKSDASELLDDFEQRAQVSSVEPPKQEEPSLLDYLEERQEQAAHLSRVRSRIGLTVLAFLRGRLSTPGLAEFTAAELRGYVSEVCGTAPGSPDRILRALRQDAECDYVLVNRRQSRYRVTAVRAATTEAA